MSAWNTHPQPALSRAQVEAALAPALPTVEHRYPAFYRTARNRWWKPLMAALVALAWVIAMSIAGLIWFVRDGTLERMVEAAERGDALNPMESLVMTPGLFLMNNVAVASAILFAMLGQRIIWGQRPRWLSSVAGGFRWGWFLRCVAWFAPFVAALVVVEFVTSPPDDVRWRDYSLLMIVGILLTTPFQAAGEEYMIRGLLQRAVGSWFPSELAGWVVATVVGSLVFMSLHLAADPWLNVFYLLFGVIASWLAWRTGGLEAAVALHVVNNLLAEVPMPFTDFSGAFDRSVGAGSPAVLVHVAVLAIPTALVAWHARRLRLVTASAPGAAEVDVALAQWQAAYQGVDPTRPGGVG